ncbi:thrombospondin type 3 repeat-containing protein [Bacterioplanoides sp. SCSIO 12839]|uniref:thrombospondin type 3 repeat-containing protein n=1 Tax=Bacterioplanoides sp. SCSIO 12839 TaxID=2829569 RepID=UPI0021075E1B|nr:thrombospondin type 3 repeat-containing protein [Bacterioplanoides sp. SCSIO 12839]UTW47973.1 thrombospondin type 3 repeat-containing protein [Bacterioplanoides sp. SCSIO 12839]
MKLSAVITTILLWPLLSFSVITQAALVDIKENNNVVYALYAAPNKIIRYDMTTDSFLDEITLSKVPSAFYIDDSHIYLSFNRELRQLSHDGSENNFIRNTSSSISGITGVNNYLIAAQSDSNVTTINKQTLTFIENRDSHYNGQSFIGSSLQNAYYYRTTSVSPSDIHIVSLNVDGTTQRDNDSPYHGDYPNADKIFLNSSENKIYDNAGIIYFSENLNYAGSLSGSFDALTFSQDNPIILREGELILFDQNAIEQGRIQNIGETDFLASYSNKVFTFSSVSNSSLTAKSYDISSFNLPDPGDAIDPTNLSYEAEIIEHNFGDTVFLLDQETLNVFRWDLVNEKYLTSLPLLNYPQRISYSKAHDRIYLGYDSGKITYFDLSSDSPSEQQLTSLPQSVHGLKAFDQYLFAADESGAWNTQYLFNKEGTLLDSKDWRTRSPVYMWNPELNNMYYLSSSDIYWNNIDIVNEKLGVESDSKYHYDTLSRQPPLIMISNNQLILNGGGQILNPNDQLEILNNLSNSISDAVWASDTLITVTSDGGSYQVWKDNYELEIERAISTTAPIRLFENNGDLIIMSSTSGKPVFERFSLGEDEDRDGDGVKDLIDNCLDIANSNQLDTDSDSTGNECDSDNDNDSIPDTYELANNMDPLNASDALLDNDSDGYSNLIEFKLGSDLNDASSVPEVITSISENFNEGSMGMFYSNGNKPWNISPSGKNGSIGLSSSASLDKDTTSSLFITGNFSEGVMSFEHYQFPNSDYQLSIWIDDQHETSFYFSYDNNWESQSFNIEAGTHTIEFRVSTTYFYPDGPSQHLIDNVEFGRDSDQDGIADQYDNCPTISNSWQEDTNNNGIGDECEGQYADDDADGIPLYRDNCPTVSNPEQKDLDFDQYGDACDTDIDGDGINNEIEDSYDFLNPKDSSDALQDQDQDGISNLEEILTGTNPIEANERVRIELLEYFPLGNIDATTRDGGGYQILRGDRPGEYIMSDKNSALYQKFTVTNLGIELTEFFTPEDNFTYNLRGLVEIPKSMYLNEKLTFKYSITRNGQDEANGEQTISLIDIGTTIWNGKGYDYITLRNGDAVRTYLKGIGPMYNGWVNDGEGIIQSISINSLDDTENIESADSSGSSSGGSINPIWALMLFGLLFNLRRRSY